MDKKQLAERILSFVEKLKTLNPLELVAMMAIKIPSCGTPGCHAGWAAVALKVSGNSYQAGAKALAEYLGFDSDDDLKAYMKHRPHIWGNEHGYGMFCSCIAFDEPSGEFPLSVIIRHWEKVAERLTYPIRTIGKYKVVLGDKVRVFEGEDVVRCLVAEVPPTELGYKFIEGLEHAPDTIG